ncbi:MAG: RluA family pseudouridine synthase [Candidatus Sumerlaeota bacterium]|nr:RluA family pseudouridine synthase [Candidatus Sumerlaeota bacterium]
MTSENAESEPLSFPVPPDARGMRVDAWIAARVAGLSRSRAQALLEAGEARVDGLKVKPSHRLSPGELVEVRIPPPEEPTPQAEAIPLDVVYEDESLIVINKPAGLVTHPAPGHSGGTLVNALLHRCQDLSGVGGVKRPGIVHRLDRDTSGLLVVAKNDAAHQALAGALARREMTRRYLAIVSGAPREAAGRIEAPIGRSRADRTRMAVDVNDGRPAVTCWEVERWGPGVAVLRLKLETGRTHQIRVHLALKGLPIIGDRIYGLPVKREIEKVPHSESRLIQALAHVQRQMLHAARLEFPHPVSAKTMQFDAPPPEDMRVVLEAIPAV